MEVPHGGDSEPRDGRVIQQRVPPLLDLRQRELAGELDAQVHQRQVTRLG